MSNQTITPSQLLKLKVLALTIISVAIVVIIGWFTQSLMLVRIVEFGGTMKFNTAFLFVLSGIIIFPLPAFTFKRKINLLLSSIILIISSITLVEHIFTTADLIDNLVIHDRLSTVRSGRMSIATAGSFFLFSIANGLIASSKTKFKRLGDYLLVVILILALMSIISFILQIPLKNRMSFMDSMAVHTSISFFLLGIAASLKNPTSAISIFNNSTANGTKMIRKVLPFILIIPIFLNIIFSTLIYQDLIDADSGLVLHTVALILIGCALITIYGKNINRIEAQNQVLEQSYHDINKELLDYKYAIDRVLLVSIASPDQKMVYVNDAFCEASEYDRSEIIGKDLDIIRTNHHTQEFYEDLWRTVAQGDIWQGEILNKTKSGKKNWFEVTIVPFKNSQGEIYQYLTLAKDIGLSKKAEELNIRYLNELKAKNRELKEFSFIASHDLQEPLRTLSNFSDLLIKKYINVLDEQGVELLEFIGSATNRMQTLVHDILYYSRIGQETARTEVDIQKLVEDVKQDLYSLIQDSKTAIKVGKLPKIQAYETEIRLVFQNLITNSIKFKKEDINPYLEIKYSEDSTHHRFSIIDNGIGIEPKYKNKVFLIFQRLHKESNYTGTGIGLAHCKKIITRHQGEIWFEPNSHKGTTFHFTISKNNHEEKT
ncbi:sensor histidine kinase [Roseivirga echinicomitans]